MTFENLPITDTWLGRPAPIVRIDNHLNISNANKTFLKTFNLLKDDIVLQPASRLLNRLSPETDSKDLFKKLLEASRHFEREHTFQTDSGSEIALPEIKITTPDGKWRWFRLKPIYTYRLGVEMKNQPAKSLRRGLEIEFVDVTSEKQKAALSQAAMLLNSELDLDTVLTNIQSVLHTVIPHDRANIILEEGGQWYVKNKWQYSSEGLPIALPASETVDMMGKPLLQAMIDSHEPLLVNNTGDPTTGYKKISSDSPEGSWIGVPIIADDKVIGFINLNANRTNLYTQEDAKLVKSFADHIAIAIRNAHLHGEVKSLSLHDEKTGLYNDRFFYLALEQQIKEALRYPDQNFSIIFADINRMSAFNDTEGYPCGDKVLQMFAQALSKARRADIKARYAGEEFAVLLPHTSHEKATIAAQHILEELSKLDPIIIKQGGRCTKHPNIDWHIGDKAYVDASLAVVSFDEIRRSPHHSRALGAIKSDEEQIKYCKEALLLEASIRIHQAKEKAREFEANSRGLKDGNHLSTQTEIFSLG